jgi:hypothetical protein
VKPRTTVYHRFLTFIDKKLSLRLLVMPAAAIIFIYSTLNPDLECFHSNPPLAIVGCHHRICDTAVP